MPYVTVTKPTVIFNPQFDGLEYYSNGRLITPTGFTVELKPGDVYFTGSIARYRVGLQSGINGGYVPVRVMMEITDWYNPTYIYFDLVQYRGYSNDYTGYRHYAYFAGAFLRGPEQFRSKWVHNGRYYFNGKEIELRPKAVEGGFPTSDTIYSEFDFVHQVANNLTFNARPPNSSGSDLITAAGISLNAYEPIMTNPTWAHKTMETGFAGLFKITKYHRGGGESYGEKYFIRAPLAWNYALAERFIIKDYFAGTKWEPATAPAKMTVFTSCFGSKPTHTVNVVDASTGNSDNYSGWGMVGSDGDHVTLQFGTQLPRQGGEAELHRFRFEIPYGIR